MEDPVGLAPREDINEQTLVAETMDEAGMNCLAPNLLGIVGAAVASKLVEVAGSLMNLSKIESSHIAFCGFWTETSEKKERVFYLDGAELIRDTPPILRNRFRRLLAASCRLAAQVDSTNSDPTGETGKMLRDKILKQINIHTLHALHL